MTVSVDTTTTSIRTNTDTTISFSHAGGTNGPHGDGVKGIVVIFIVDGSITDHVSTVTYAGNTMSNICRAVTATGGGTEPGYAQVFFLGSQVGDVPNGTQTVSYTLNTGTADDIFVTCTSLFGIGNLEVQSSNTDGGAARANPSLLLTTEGNTCLAFCGFYSGLGDPANITDGSGITRIGSNDFGQSVAVVTSQTTASSSDFTFSFTSASDDAALAGVSIREHPIKIYTKASGTWYPAELDVYKESAWRNASPFVKLNGRWIS